MRMLPLLVVFALLAAGIGYAFAGAPCAEYGSRCVGAPSRTVETPASTPVEAGTHHDPPDRRAQSSKS